MARTKKPSHRELLTALDTNSELDEKILTTYARLWQFETWLRRMAYVELRAKYGNAWDTKLQGGSIAHARSNDKQLTHMPSAEETDLSYTSFGKLIKVISDEWSLFESYLPPKAIWDAKLQEVEQVRNRVAHFRRGHRDDLQRVVQLLRDVDQGFWRFCTSLNSASAGDSPSNDARDPVIYQYAYLIHYAPISNAKYEGNYEFANLAHVLELVIDVIQRPWQKLTKEADVAGLEGFLYDIKIIPHDNRMVNYEEFLAASRHVHNDIVFICLQESQWVSRVIVPAVLGKDRLVEIINTLLMATSASLHRDNRKDANLDFNEWPTKDVLKVESIVNSWPEYVIGPRNPILFLDSSMPCSFFTV